MTVSATDGIRFYEEHHVAPSRLATSWALFDVLWKQGEKAMFSRLKERFNQEPQNIETQREAREFFAFETPGYFKHKAEAIQTIEIALQRTPNDAEIMAVLGDLLRSTNPARALELLKAAHVYLQDDIFVLSRLAAAEFAVTGNKKAALALLAQAKSKLPEGCKDLFITATTAAVVRGFNKVMLSDGTDVMFFDRHKKA